MAINVGVIEALFFLYNWNALQNYVLSGSLKITKFTGMKTVKLGA